MFDEEKVRELAKTSPHIEADGSNSTWHDQKQPKSYMGYYRCIWKSDITDEFLELASELLALGKMRVTCKIQIKHLLDIWNYVITMAAKDGTIEIVTPQSMFAWTDYHTRNARTVPFYVMYTQAVSEEQHWSEPEGCVENLTAAMNFAIERDVESYIDAYVSGVSPQDLLA